MVVEYFSVFRGGSPSACDLHAHLSCHDDDDHGGVRRDRGGPCVLYGLRRNGACRGVRACRDDVRDVRNHGGLLSYGDRLSFRGDRASLRAYDAFLPYGDHHRSDGLCDTRPCDTSYDNLRSLHPCRDVFYDRVYRLYGGVRVRDGVRGDRARPSASCDVRRARDGDLRGDACRDARAHLYHDGGVPCALSRLCDRVHDDDVRDVPCHRRVHDGGRDDGDWPRPRGPSPWNRVPDRSKRLINILK